MGLVSFCMLLLAALLVVLLHADLGLAQSSSPRSLVTPDFFGRLLSRAPNGCRGKTFYTYNAFIAAAEDGMFSGFGTTGSDVMKKREVAAFLANVLHETGGLCYVHERNPQSRYCDETKGSCIQGQSYFGRGPLQLTWNYNYLAAGRAIGFRGLHDPEIVAQDPNISFKTAVWFWMKNSQCHSAIINGQGFGGTIRAINSKECNGGNHDQVASRVRHYQNLCQHFGVAPGQNIYC